jgi:UDP-N-acetylmuramoyl-tripeptide--D-alanyl-D-alanine ligase
MKKVSITLNDIFNLPGSIIYNPDNYKPAKAVTIDSRNVPVESIFAAIKGDKFDGHDFIEDAVKNKALAIVLNKKKYKKFEDLDIPIIAVDDTIKTLGELAKIWRNKLRTKIIGITGSAGKTSTKEMLSSILSEKFKVNKTLANNNNHIGVPLTIFSTNNVHDILVAELGTNHFGEIEYTANILQPDYALITNIGSSHLEYLKNKKGVLTEKLALFKAAAKRNGALFINNDDPLIKRSVKNYPNKISYAYKKEADAAGKLMGYNKEGLPIVEIVYNKKKLKVEFPLHGEQNAKNLLAAVTIAIKLGLTKDQIYTGIKKLKAINKRLNVKRINDFILIDDTYNANPESMKFAIELLNKMKSYPKKIAVLGDMFELGDAEEKLHKDLAAVIKRNKIDIVLTIGNRMKFLHEALKITKTETQHFNKRENLKKYLLNLDKSGAVILVKGSRGMKMEEFVSSMELINKN